MHSIQIGLCLLVLLVRCSGSVSAFRTVLSVSSCNGTSPIALLIAPSRTPCGRCGFWTRLVFRTNYFRAFTCGVFPVMVLLVHALDTKVLHGQIDVSHLAGSQEQTGCLVPRIY